MSAARSLHRDPPLRDAPRVRVRVTRRGDSYQSISAIGVLRQKVVEATIYADELPELEKQVLTDEQALLLAQATKQYLAHLSAHIAKVGDDVSPATIEAHIGLPKAEWATKWPAPMLKAERSYVGPTAESIFYELTKTERFGVPKLAKLEVLETLPSPIRAQSEARRVEAAEERKAHTDVLAEAIAKAISAAMGKRNS